MMKKLRTKREHLVPPISDLKEYHEIKHEAMKYPQSVMGKIIDPLYQYGMR
jgi:hypothetical protein